MPFKCSTEVEDFPILPEGDYPAKVIHTDEGWSNASEKYPNGNPMLKLKIKVFSPDGKSTNIFSNIVPQMNWLVKHFWESVGEPDNFLKGEWEHYEFLGKFPTVKIVIEEYKGKKQNKIADFVSQKSAVEKESNQKHLISKDEEHFIEDDIPF